MILSCSNKVLVFKLQSEVSLSIKVQTALKMKVTSKPWERIQRCSYLIAFRAYTQSKVIIRKQSEAKFNRSFIISSQQWIVVMRFLLLISRGDVKTQENHCKVNGPNSVTYLDRTPICEWWVVRCRSKNAHQKGIMCLTESGLCAL